MTEKDRPALEAAKPELQRLVDLPPFLDETEWAPLPRSHAASSGAPPADGGDDATGDKAESYRILAESLTSCGTCHGRSISSATGTRAAKSRPYSPSWDPVSVIMEPAMGSDFASAMNAAMLVWPAINEAYGMVFLEAQLFGNPVVAGDCGGVESVVEHGGTGILTPPGDVKAFARSVGSLIRDPVARRRMGEQRATSSSANETSRKPPYAFRRAAAARRSKAHERAGPHRGDAPAGGRAPHPRGGYCTRFREGGSCNHAGFRRHADFASRAEQRHIRPTSAGAYSRDRFQEVA